MRLKDKTKEKVMLFLIKHKKTCANLNLKGIDLRSIPASFWGEIDISNTDFSHAKLNFNPAYLKGEKQLQNINFSGVDIHHLTSNDFSGVKLNHCNFENTGIEVDFNTIFYPPRNIEGVKLAKGMKLAKESYIDEETLQLNPDYPFTAHQIILATVKQFSMSIFPIKPQNRISPTICDYRGLSPEKYYEKLQLELQCIIDTLEKYHHKDAINFINKLLEKNTMEDVLDFLAFQNFEIYIKDMNFTKEEINLLDEFIIKRPLHFTNCAFPISYKEMNQRKSDRNNFFANATFHDCSLFSMDYQNNGIKKVKNTSFSCHTSVYVKLGNGCNACCSFCKNRTEEKKKTDVKRIESTLFSENLFSHLNAIYLGGGEPSIYLKEVKDILEKYSIYAKEKKVRPDIYMYTNGSGNWEEIYDLYQQFQKKFMLSKSPLKIILSRPAIEDREVAEILGIKYSLEDPYLRKLMDANKILFSLTCADDKKAENYLEEYIKFGHFYTIHNFIIQSLEKKTESTIDYAKIEAQFEFLYRYLCVEEYTLNFITSTSYFDLERYKREENSISLKRYFDEKELEQRWISSQKHSFDLGIDTNGELYRDFQMQKKIKIILFFIFITYDIVIL